MALIQAGRYAELARRLLGIKGQVALRDLDEQLVMAILLEDARAEFDYLMGRTRAVGSATLAAGGAGTFAKAALVNPAASGVLVVLDEILFALSAIGEISVRQVTSANATGQQRGITDSRLGTWGSGGQLTVCNVTTLVDATSRGIEIVRYRAGNASAPTPVRLGAVFAPGAGLEFQAPDNVGLHLTCHWSERAILAEERASG